jgi:hypothetical protein
VNRDVVAWDPTGGGFAGGPTIFWRTPGGWTIWRVGRCVGLIVGLPILETVSAVTQFEVYR